MDKQAIKNYIKDFNDSAYQADDFECWSARKLQKILGYDRWENFAKVIERAKIACDNSGVVLEDNFADITQEVEMPNGGVREIDDVLLSRYAGYLVAQNADPSKEPVAFAMSYFAVQTRKQEVLEKRIEDWERLQAREKLTISEKDLSAIVFERGVDQFGLAAIRSMGDKALFGGLTTNGMKSRLGVHSARALADFLPTITIKAKDFANEITVFNVKKNDQLQNKTQISDEHVKNNRAVRKILLDRGIRPEELPAEEDIQKLKRRVQSDDKKLLKDVSTKE